MQDVGGRRVQEVGGRRVQEVGGRRVQEVGVGGSRVQEGLRGFRATSSALKGGYTTLHPSTCFSLDRTSTEAN